MPTQNPIYSKINYENAYEIKKNILEIQANLLNILRQIKTYKAARKSEIMLKLKLKDHLSKTKQSINKVLQHTPQTKGIKKAKLQNKQKHSKKQEKMQENIEEQLTDIQKRLAELS